MTKPQFLPNAPIVEALLDISATLPENVELGKLAALQERLGSGYPSKQVRHAWTGKIELKTQGPPQAKGSAGPIGYLFASADGKQVVQARRDGFSFSRLKPYKDWDAFGAEARALWTYYRSHLKPSKVTRFALRFIAARQLPSGRWTSKLGPLEDVHHLLYGLAGVTYGETVRFLRRRLRAPSSR